MMPFGTDAEGILATVIGNIMPARMGQFILLLTPTHARTLAGAGWTKKALKEYIVKNSIVPEGYFEKLGLDGSKAGPGGTRDIFRPDPRDPDPVQVYVYGGFGSWMGFAQGGPLPVTRKAVLPKDWDNLVKKYKNIVPNYLRY
jgi:hypothetical protein